MVQTAKPDVIGPPSPPYIQMASFAKLSFSLHTSRRSRRLAIKIGFFERFN
jgi:hypothetical protein